MYQCWCEYTLLKKHKIKTKEHLENTLVEGKKVLDIYTGVDWVMCQAVKAMD